MSDYRNYDFRNWDDPFRNDSRLDPNLRTPNATGGWIAAAVFLVIVLAVAFGAGHKPGQGATNMAANSPSAATHMAPAMVPAMVPPPSATPAPNATVPIAPAPAAPSR